MRNFNTHRWAMFCPECALSRGECIADKTEKGGVVRTYECLFCGSEFDVFFPEVIHKSMVAEKLLEASNG
jgi:transcription elongation factor Elf1